MEKNTAHRLSPVNAQSVELEGKNKIVCQFSSAVEAGDKIYFVEADLTFFEDESGNIDEKTLTLENVTIKSESGEDYAYIVRGGYVFCHCPANELINEAIWSYCEEFSGNNN